MILRYQIFNLTIRTKPNQQNLSVLHENIGNFN